MAEIFIAPRLALLGAAPKPPPRESGILHGRLFKPGGGAQRGVARWKRRGRAHLPSGRQIRHRPGGCTTCLAPGLEFVFLQTPTYGLAGDIVVLGEPDQACADSTSSRSTRPNRSAASHRKSNGRCGGAPLSSPSSDTPRMSTEWTATTLPTATALRRMQRAMFGRIDAISRLLLRNPYAGRRIQLL